MDLDQHDWITIMDIAQLILLVIIASMVSNAYRRRP